MSEHQPPVAAATPSFTDESSAGWFAQLGQDADLIAEELDFAPRTADMLFVSFLRRHSQFGYFLFGPLAIDVKVVEELLYRTAKRGAGGPEHPPIADDLVRFNRVIVEEELRSDRPRGRELNYLLAAMRFKEGLPARVFGELGVTAEQVEEYAAQLSAGKPGAPKHVERLLSTEEAAEYYGVHVQTVRSWIRAGKLPASKLAGQKSIRIRESDLDRVLEPMASSSGNASDLPVESEEGS
jgi:excisionase family DNA binding protein